MIILIPTAIRHFWENVLKMLNENEENQIIEIYTKLNKAIKNWEEIRKLNFPTMLDQQSLSELIDLSKFHKDRNDAYDTVNSLQLEFYKVLESLGFDRIKIRRFHSYTISRIENEKRKEYFLNAEQFS